MNAHQSMRGWYPDPFGRYDERYFIDGHFTDRARLFLGSRARTFHDPIPGALEIETLETSPSSYEDDHRASSLTLTLIGVGALCLLIALFVGAFVHVSVGGVQSADCGTAFAPSSASHAITKRCNSAGLTANRALATIIGLTGVGLIVFGVVKHVGTERLSTLWSGGSQYADPPMMDDYPDGGATRICPWCAETIKQAAVICRFCGRVTPATHDTGDPGADGFVFDPRRGAWTRVDVAARGDDVDDVETVFELPVRPTALPGPPGTKPPDVIDVDGE